MKILGYFHRLIHPIHRKIPASVRFLNHSYNLRVAQPMSTFSEDPELKEFMDFIDNRNNYGKAGVPKGAGTDSDDGFDLGRMRRLMQLLGNPQCKFKNRLFTLLGQREKGSTVPFLSSILRAQDYSVGCYTSPHIGTIRERITLGVSGAPLPTKTLINHFQSLKMVLERAIELENGCLSHFELVLGGQFLPHIEQILRDKASSISSPVVSF